MIAVACTPDALSQSQRLSWHATVGGGRNLRFGRREALQLLENCSSFTQLKLLHARILRNGLSHDQLLARKLLQLCSSYRKMEYAASLFHQIHQPHTFTWNLMIRAYTVSGASQQALLLYNLMISQDFPPDKFTFPFVVKACLASSAIHKGKEVHGMAIKTGFSDDTFLHNTLMDLYIKCGDIDSGRKVFEKMRVHNVVSWTTLINGLVSCGELDAGREAFEEMPTATRNVVSWTAMINGYVQNQRPEEAFELFRRMRQNVRARPNEYTLVSLLKACADLGNFQLGRWIHGYALNNGFKLGVFLGTALIDMYSKCGSLEDAKCVFYKMETKSLATWNTMITSLGVHGRGEEALALFAQMEEANVRPDAITFVGVLCACVHTNKPKEGYRYFKYMGEHYGIRPVLDHHTCMAELHRRSGMSNDRIIT